MIKNNSKSLTGAALGFAAVMFVPAHARADLFQAPFGPGGTWRIYETTPGATLTFKAAFAEAQSKKDPATNTIPGHLISITSAAKERFAWRSLNQAAGGIWLGLSDREGVAPGAEESQTFGAADDANRINGWKWTNGDPYGGPLDYRNWNAGEPNNAGTGGAEDAVEYGGGLWNDNQSGYDADDPVVSDSGNSASENNAPPALRYIIEYANNSPTPLPGIRQGAVFAANLPINIPPNTAGNWSVQEVRDLTLLGNIFDAVTQASGGTGRILNAQVPYLDVTDPGPPNGVPNGGPSLSTPPNLFLSDTPNADDDSILTTAKTRIIIPAAGEYTIQVRSDDGFALRVKGQNWTAVGGSGYIDPLDPTTMLFEIGTGDSNTRGVLNLAAGEYDVEFVTWEGGGGGYYEVTAATGNRLNSAEAQWLPLGSTTTIPAFNTVNPVHLKTAAAVANANVRGRTNVLAAMRSIIDRAIANNDGTAISGLRGNLELGEGDDAVATALDDQTRMPFNNSNALTVDPPPADPVADQYITKVEGSFTLVADANGNATPGELIDVTFGLFCDDGASMRIIGQDFTAVNDFDVPGDPDTRVATLEDNAGDMTLTADYDSGNTLAYGLVKLREGQTYPFVCYMYENGGGSNFNLRWELGDLTEIGFDAGDGERALRTAAVATEAGETDALNLTAQAKVTNSNNNFPAPFLAQARVITAEAIAQGTAQTGTTPIVLLNEGAAPAAGTGSITGASFSGTRAVMPVGGVDNYVTRVNGRIVVDNQNSTPSENLTLTFGVFADDGADFRIIGRDFTSVTGIAGAVLENINGDDSIAIDVYTGNTNTTGIITLPEGEYDFEGHMYEGGGGSGYEVWYAVGEFTAFNATDFRPLTTDVGVLLPANTGIALAAAAVTPPPTGNLAITAFNFVPATGAYTLTFSSNAGSNYAVEYTIGFEAAGAPSSPLKWNIVPGKSTVPGVVGATTVTGNISELINPAGQLPNGQKAFFRVKSL